jgi:hypothetical protein
MPYYCDHANRSQTPVVRAQQSGASSQSLSVNQRQTATTPILPLASPPVRSVSHLHSSRRPRSRSPCNGRGRPLWLRFPGFAQCPRRLPLCLADAYPYYPEKGSTPSSIISLSTTSNASLWARRRSSSSAIPLKSATATGPIASTSLN